MMDGIEKLAEAIKENESFFITAHINMDGDALGSSAALALALVKLGKRCFFKGEGAFAASLCKLSGIRKLFELPELSDYKAAIAVDCADIGRMGKYADDYKKAATKLVIDHHETNFGFGDINYIRSYPATAQCVYELIASLGVKAEGEIAECLYAAFLTDTGRFSHSDVNRETMLIAAQLYDAGFDTARVNKLIFGTRSVAASRLLGRGLDKLELLCGGRISVIVLTRRDFEQCGASEPDSEGIVNYALEVEGVETALFLKEQGDGFKASLRSAGRIDVAEIAVKYGGGGHRLAAGCALKGGPEEIKRVLTEEIARKLELL